MDEYEVQVALKNIENTAGKLQTEVAYVAPTLEYEMEAYAKAVIVERLNENTASLRESVKYNAPLVSEENDNEYARIMVNLHNTALTLESTVKYTAPAVETPETEQVMVSNAGIMFPSVSISSAMMLAW